MSTPPIDGARPVDGSSPADPEPAFDPYRYGAPDHYIAPEYAPPGWLPPAHLRRPDVPYAKRVDQAPVPPAEWALPPGEGAQPPSEWALPPAEWAPPPFSEYPSPRGNRRAVASFVLGLLSVVLCFTCSLDAFLILPAMVLGSLGLGEARRNGGHGRGLALAGLALAAVGTVLAILVTIFILPKVAKCANDFGVNSAQYKSCLMDSIH